MKALNSNIIKTLRKINSISGLIALGAMIVMLTLIYLHRGGITAAHKEMLGISSKPYKTVATDENI